MEALDAGGTAEVELEELRHEKELQKEEIQKLQAQIQSHRLEIQVPQVPVILLFRGVGDKCVLYI